jgi:hypothetical protein
LLISRWWLVVDDVAALLERAVAPQLSSAPLPPLAMIEAVARRRQMRRSLMSLTVVVLLVIGCVVGLASAGHASETGPVTTSAAGAPMSPGGPR